MILRISFFLSLLFLNGCYSFTGSSLAPEVKTIQIKTFPNYALLQNPNLSQQFTLDLQSRFSQRTKLQFTEELPDILIEGEIKDYKQTAVNIQSNETSAENKLTITVNVRYQNKIQPEKNFERTFSQSENFSANQLLSSIEDQLVQDINVLLIDQIFNDIVADW